MPPIKLVIADDETLFLNGLKAILENQARLKILFTANNGESLLKQLKTSELPDIVLLDLRMKEMDGTEITEHLKEFYPDLKIIILSSHYREAFLGYMMKLGVNAFLPKNIALDELMRIIEKVDKKGLYFTDSQLNSLHQQLSSGQKMSSPKLIEETELTRREKEILQLICEQYTNAEIAEKLFISIRTVEGHRNNLLLKTGAKNTVGLVLYALFHQLVNWEEKLVEWSLN